MFSVESHHPKLDWFKKMVGCKNSQMSFFQIPFLAFSLLY